MRRLEAVILALVLAGCTKADPHRPVGDDGVPNRASRDAQEKTMASVTLRSVITKTNQPSDAVGWGPDGVVSADGRGVVSWNGDVPGTQVPLDSRAVGSPTGISFLPGGAVGVAAAKLDAAGALVGDQAKLDNALVHGLPGVSAFDYTIRTAAWSADGTRLWIGVELRSRKRSRDAARPSSGAPTRRHLVLDDSYAVQQVIDEPGTWRTVAASSVTVVTVGDQLSIWPSISGAAPQFQVRSQPVAIAVSSDGGIVAAAEISTVRLWRSDGTELASWEAQPTISLMALAVSADGQWVATGDAGGMVRLWRVDSPAAAAAELIVDGQVQSIAFAPAGDRLVVGSSPQTVSILAIDAR